MSDEERVPEPSVPNFYAIIPAAVRYDKQLRPNAKLLYGEISALTSAYGYCWATNQYFADLYGFAKKTVSELISELADRGFIQVEICRKKGGNGAGAVEMRKIWLNASFDCADLSGKNRIGYPVKKGDPIPQKVKENITSDNITPVTPQGGEGCPEFEIFWKAWPAGPRKVDRPRALRAWKKAKIDETLFRQIMISLEQYKKSAQWTKERGEYIPQPATWLNGRRWEADVQVAACDKKREELIGQW